ncbi:hypothetical protein I3842_07G050400 [Carya illinoinensis]|uniref:Uncharacterized protein n=1 Tax=Carya illinoinensis TaxID=32201 RepID=A0A922JD72_CARIL|nr:hypothetical protein I3842_07G050400 [Carya illinoinensis]
MQVANFTTKRILIDNGSSMDILFWDAFTFMEIDTTRLLPTQLLLKGFLGETVHPTGTIALLVLVGDPPCVASVMVDFLVVKAHSS